MNDFVKRASTKIAKLSHEQVEQLIEVITEENKLQDAILGSLSTGLLICDNSGFVIQSNKASERIVPFLKSPAEILGQEIPVWHIIDDAEIAAFVKTAWETQKTNVSKDFSCVAPSGQTRYLTISILPLVQEKIFGTILKIDDITEKINQDILLRRMENLASLTNLAANVAHEIKNPLGAISIHIQLMQKALAKARRTNTLPEEKHSEHYLGIITEEIERLNKIIVDFLLAVRPVKAEFAFVNPDTVVAGLADFIKPELVEKNIQLEFRILENCPDLMLDEKLFKQVLLNLLKNAAAAIPPANGRIFISSHIKENQYVLTITDNGCGMDETTLAHIFEPYFTTKIDGTGLGLTMAYKIIKEFAGDISVRSAVGEGTTFIIFLPLPQKKRLLTT
ncbi:MAG: ATP-binding protein [Treponemataceae bacterium]|nr:MAG: ATP-binding protein [Treponemataceae bacterium]